jgi:hypothetical protein
MRVECDQPRDDHHEVYLSGHRLDVAIVTKLK